MRPGALHLARNALSYLTLLLNISIKPHTQITAARLRVIFYSTYFYWQAPSEIKQKKFSDVQLRKKPTPLPIRINKA